MWKCLNILLCLPVICLAQPDDETIFRHALYTILHAELEHTTPAYSDDVLKRLTAETGLARAGIRTRLLTLLDSLDHQRRKKTEVWKALTQLGGADVPSKASGKMLQNMIKEGRSILTGQDNYLLDNGIKRASRRAKLPGFQGRALILRSLDWALSESAGEEEDESFGILVSGHTNRFEIHKDPLFIFFDSQDEAYVMEEVREIQRFIIPLLVRRLPESESIKWAVRQREANVLVEPRYRLVIGVDNLTFTGSNRNLRPCLEATVELLDGSTRAALESWEFDFCTTRYGSEVTHELSLFYDEIADEIRKLVDGFIAR